MNSCLIRQAGSAFVGKDAFTFEGDLFSDVWVLGDLKNLENQLKQNDT